MNSSRRHARQARKQTPGMAIHRHNQTRHVGSRNTRIQRLVRQTEQSSVFRLGTVLLQVRPLTNNCQAWR